MGVGEERRPMCCKKAMYASASVQGCEINNFQLSFLESSGCTSE